MTMRPDPTFHASPKLAMEAPPESFAYTLLLSPDFSKPDALAVIDVKPSSPTFSQIVHTVTSITVEDTGPGIDPKKSDEMFGAFLRRSRTGWGLGLAICRMIVEHHNGELSVTLASPHGAIFRINLPLLKQPH